MSKNLLPTTPTGRRFVGLLGGAAALAGSAAALTFAASPASGITTLVVDSNADAAADATHCTNGTMGDCTLRDALAAAQDGDTITFDASIGSTITMTPVNGQFVIDHAISINGPGRDALTIDGANGTRVFYVTSAVTGTVALSGVTVTHGNAGNAQGGGLATAFSQQLSLALDLTISDAAFLDSTAVNGGGLSIVADSVHLSDVIVSGNTADYSGGLAVDANDFDGSRLDVTGNTATRYNAGAYISSPLYGQQLTISDSTFSNNTEGLDISTGAAGLSIRWDGGTATITGSTFADNVGRGAKLRGYLANITMANCTVSGNSNSNSGAGVFLYNPGGTATIAQTTITTNVSAATNPASYEGSGLGFYSFTNGGSVTITGSIIAGNIGADVHDIGSIIATTLPFSIDHSLIGTVSSNIAYTNAGGVTANVTDPGLNALANNGGPTKTMSLKATSPAIDAGPNSVATFPGNQFDQRGPGFARIAFGRSDIGAFEIQEPTPVDPDAPVVPNFTG
jgi:hypothetical protein